MIQEISTCRVCQSSDLTLGFSVPAPIVSTFPTVHTDLDTLLRCPLDILECQACALVQLRHQVAPAHLYQEYWYESGINERMQEELATIALEAQSRIFQLNQGDCVLDIGANDGTLLQHYPRWAHRVGVDPSPTFAKTLGTLCDAYIQGTFPECLGQIPPNAYKIITSIAVFYDLADPVAAAEAIRTLLHPYGVWVCQFQDLGQQVRDGVWDNFVHEHVLYLTLASFSDICRRAGLQVFDVERTLINGGSLRIWVGHHGARPQQPAVQRVLSWEMEQFYNHSWTARFARRMAQNISQIQAMVEVAAERGPVDLYGASTKGNTLLQATGVSPLMRAAWERNPRKYGRMTCTGVPIIDETLGRAEPPEALLATIWQFKSQIIEREKDILRQSRMILPLPEATWIEHLEEA